MQFKVKNMTCTNCAKKIEKNLAAHNYEANINYASQIAEVNVEDTDQIFEVIKIIKQTGYEAIHMQSDKLTLKIDNINCANCVNKIKKLVADYTLESEVNLATKQGYFILKDTVSEEELINIIEKAGYPVIRNNNEKKSKFNFDLIRLIIGVVATVYFLLKMILIHFLHFNIPILEHEYLDLILATLVQFTVGLKYYKEAYIGIKLKTFGMDFLVASSTSIAYFYSLYLLFFTDEHMLFFEIQVILLSIIYLGNYIEEKIKAKARKNLESLMDLHIKQATVIKDDISILKDIEFIHSGEILVIKSGEQIALDGEIIKGSSTIDESLLTGEVTPILKKEKDNVFGGTINQNATIYVKVTKEQSQTYLANIIKQVNDLSSVKPKIEQLGDKIVLIFVPIIFTISLLTFLAWLLLTHNLNDAVYAGLATLVIACPCALGLATPLTFMIGNSKFYQNQLLVKDIGKMMNVNEVKTIALDKTGTITTKTVDKLTGELDNEKLLNLIYNIELQSKHPLAQAITSYLEQYNYQSQEVLVEELPGYGVRSCDVAIGSLKLLQKYEIDTTGLDNQDVYVIKDNKLALTFSFKMNLLDENISILNDLSKKFDLVMITGDNNEEAQKVAQNINFSAVHSNTLPEEKKQIIEQLQNNNQKVMYIGDGINDTIALALADYSIAINNEVDAVKQISDVVLIENDLSKIDLLFTISKRIKNNVYQNYFWAFSYNVIAIPLAVTGNLNPLVAGIMMSLSSILVVLNANRLLYIKKTKK